MSFIDLGTEYSDVKESKPLTEGMHHLRVQTVEHVQQDEKNYLKYMLFTDDPTSFEDEFGYMPAPVMHILSLPQPSDDVKDEENGRDAGSTKRFKLLQIKRFNNHFEVPMDGGAFDPQDAIGLIKLTKVIHEEYEGRPQARMRLPQVED